MGTAAPFPAVHSQSLQTISYDTSVGESKERRTRCAINHVANYRVCVKLAEELAGLLIVPDLTELKGYSTRTVATRLLDGITDGIKDCVGVRLVAGGLSVGDGNDKHRLLHSALACGRQKQTIDDLAPQFAAEWSQTTELDLAHDLVDLCFRGNVVALSRWQVRIHETDADAVVVEKSCNIGYALKNET